MCNYNGCQCITYFKLIRKTDTYAIICFCDIYRRFEYISGGGFHKSSGVVTCLIYCDVFTNFLLLISGDFLYTGIKQLKYLSPQPKCILHMYYTIIKLPPQLHLYQCIHWSNEVEVGVLL